MKTVCIFLILLIVPITSALDCPNGLVNDTYPGSCGLYTDQNKNNICDLSEEPIITPNNVTKENSFLIKKYYFLIISLSLLIIYLGSYYSSKRDLVLSYITHKKIWNFLLLLTFLGVGITGIFLTIQIEYGPIFNPPFNLLFWHVETGIAMFMISIFHLLWHYAYFKSYIK